MANGVAEIANGVAEIANA
ncbi:hypothetical protein [Nostoc sp.]